MEFLDDLIKNQADDDQPEQEKKPDVDAWEELIRNAAMEDAYSETASGQRRISRKSEKNKKRNPTRRRKRILVFLGISVFLAWGIIFGLILQVGDDITLPSFGDLLPKKSSISEEVISEDSDGDATLSPSSEENGATSDEETEKVSEPVPTPTKAPVKDAPFTRFDREIQETPGLIDLYQLRGQEYINLGAYEAALSDFNYTIALDDSRSEAYAGIGRVYYHLRRWHEAELAFKSALERSPELSDAFFWLGHIYFYKGEYKASAQAFDLAAEYDRKDAAAEAWLAITSAKLDDYPETLGAVTRALSITKKLEQELAIVFVAESWENLLEEPPDVDGAQGALLYAQKIEPNNFIPLNALANFYLEYRPERLAEAELLAHYAQNWSKNDIEKALALQTLGRIYMAKGLKKDAEESFVQAMELATVDGVVILAGLSDDFMLSRQ